MVCVTTADSDPKSAFKLYQKKRRLFPDPRAESLDGIVAMGDHLSVATLFEAYSFGIFPWPHEGLPTLWYSPDPRGVLDFENLHINKSLKKFLKKHPFQVSFNQAFEKVMRKCAAVPRPGQKGTWIHEPLIKAYCDFHQAGYAHSVEVWEAGKLVGGLYGVYVGGVFSGESMFFEKSNASKLALIKTIEVLQKNNLKWMDIQMVTPITEALGGRYISKAEFYSRLEAAHHSAVAIDFTI